MKNTDIKYRLSSDYHNLHKLLKEGIVIIGFIAIDIDNEPNMDYSRLVEMSYNEKYKTFNIGFTLFEQDFNKESFIEICKRQNVRYIQQ